MNLVRGRCESKMVMISFFYCSHLLCSRSTTRFGSGKRSGAQVAGSALNLRVGLVRTHPATATPLARSPQWSGSKLEVETIYHLNA